MENILLKLKFSGVRVARGRQFTVAQTENAGKQIIKQSAPLAGSGQRVEERRLFRVIEGFVFHIDFEEQITSQVTQFKSLNARQ
jgi:hypothetical protein